MLLPARFRPGVADGTITVAFRRWKRPSVKASGTLLSPAGWLAIDEVTEISIADISAQDAKAAGYASVSEVLDSLRPEGTLYRIRFHRLGDDPRVALRDIPVVDEDEMARLRRSLDLLPWAPSTLRLIGGQPGVVSTELAAIEGVDRPTFKRRVRRLKALGLTESLEIGYRLSPRGQTVLAALEADFRPS